MRPEGSAATYRAPVYRGLFHFLASCLRAMVHNLFQLSMRDCMNQELREGDRVFDLASYYTDREYKDPANRGTVITDTHSLTGFSIRWDNDELTFLIDTSLIQRISA